MLAAARRGAAAQLRWGATICRRLLVLFRPSSETTIASHQPPAGRHRHQTLYRVYCPKLPAAAKFDLPAHLDVGGAFSIKITDEMQAVRASITIAAPRSALSTTLVIDPCDGLDWLISIVSEVGPDPDGAAAAAPNVVATCTVDLRAALILSGLRMFGLKPDGRLYLTIDEAS